MQHIIYFLPKKRCQQSPLQQKGKGRSCQLWKRFILMITNVIPQRKCIRPSLINRDDSEDNNPLSQKVIIPVARHTLKLWHKSYYFLFKVDKKSCKRLRLDEILCTHAVVKDQNLPCQSLKQSLLLFLPDFTPLMWHALLKIILNNFFLPTTGFFASDFGKQVFYYPQNS